MGLTYEERIIIKYLRKKYHHGPKKIVDDHPEFNWNVNTVKSFLKNVDETDSAERKLGSGRPRSVRTDDNIEEVEDMILSQEDQPGTHKTPTEIADELNISRRSVKRIIDEDLQFRPLKKTKVQKLSDADIEKRYPRSQRLLEMFTKKKLEKAFFSDEKIFKVKQQYNTKNDVFYVPKGTLKKDVPDKRLHREQSGFPKQIMVSVAVSKAGKTSVLFVEPGAKVNANYYTTVLLNKMVPQMNRLTRGEDYLFMQDGARSHTAKLTLANLGKRKHLKLLEPHQWPPNSPDLNPVDYCIWGILETNVYRGRRITDLDTLKQAIVTEWAKIPQDVIDRSIDSFRKRLRRVVEVEGCHIEKYF